MIAANPTDAEAVIRASRLCKAYSVHATPWLALKEALLGRDLGTQTSALDDVTFSVRQGEIVGLVGANGAGKSTLLKILAGVVTPSSGDVAITGNLRAILELGAGFQDHLTGRQNIYLGGYCLGYSKPQIDRTMDWILDFSELRSVIDHPFRTYSTGMKARLTFAVTFSQPAEVLIVDEALAVGDVGFVGKCVARILELVATGSAALIVSHNLFLIERLCTRALYLQAGRIVADGAPIPVCKQFERDRLGANVDTTTSRPTEATTIKGYRTCAETSTAASDLAPLPAVQGLNLAKLAAVRVLDAHDKERNLFAVGDTVALELTIDSQLDKSDVNLGVSIHHENGTKVITTTTRWHLNEEGEPGTVRFDLQQGRQTVRLTFPRLFLGEGVYTISVGLSPSRRHMSPADQLFHERSCAKMAFQRPDISWNVLYDPPVTWSLPTPEPGKAKQEATATC